MSGQHLIDRPAHLVPCHGCSRHILAAIAGGLTVAADATPIDTAGEIAARLTGNSAYDITVINKRIYLVYRDLFRVMAGRKHPVVAAHQCPAGASPRYQLIPPKPPARKKEAPAKIVLLEEAPF